MMWSMSRHPAQLLDGFGGPAKAATNTNGAHRARFFAGPNSRGPLGNVGVVAQLFRGQVRSCDVSLLNGAQLARLGLGIELHPGLFKNPRFDALMVLAQQVQRAHGVMLFSGGAGLVPHDLCHHASGHLQPLCQALEGAAQAVAWAVCGLAMGCVGLLALANTYAPRRGKVFSKCQT